LNTQSTIGATSTGDDPAFTCVTGKRYNTVWYKYIPSYNGVLSVDTFGSSFDTVLGVWTGNRGSLSSQACNDDASGLQSKVQLQVVAGTVYYIEVAGYSSNSNGSLKLSVNPDDICPQISEWKGEYWDNPSLTGSPILCRNDVDLNLDWGMGSPDPSIPDDNFSARWTRSFDVSNGIYRFHLRHDDGARLYVDDILRLDVWDTCCVWDIVDVPVQAGPHTIRVEYFENGGAAHAQLWFEQIGYQFNSIATQDGWILESSETSGKGGSISATASTLRIGDNAAKKQYRSILSFSTGASLPDNAVITKVTLKVRKQGIIGGGNPITTFQGFMVDIKKGYFGTSALQTADFQTAASKTYGPFRPALSGGWYSIDLTSGKAFINKLASSGGLTQIRLRFKLDDNNNTIANYLSLYSGNAGSSYRPQLIVEYYVP
jgi:hypothetical protein